MTTDLQKLIADLESAEEGSREMDATIFIEFHPGVKTAGRIDRDGGVVGWWPRKGAYQSAREVPHFTSSVDAALQLVPEAPWPWNITMASAYGRVSLIPHHDESLGIHDPKAGHGKGSTIPLALCAAILRARLAGKGE